MSTVLHEASHNLGPSHEYAVGGKKDTVMFGGTPERIAGAMVTANFFQVLEVSPSIGRGFWPAVPGKVPS